MKAAIEIVNNLTSRDNTITFGGPRPIEVLRNEQADETAKRAAEGKEGRAEPSYLMERGLAHLTRRQQRQDQTPRQSGFGGTPAEEDDAAPPREGISPTAFWR